MAPSVESVLKSARRSAEERAAGELRGAVENHRQRHENLLRRAGGGENPYAIHRELGDVMTRSATVVRDNASLDEAYRQVQKLYERSQRCSLSDTGSWTNQNVVFTKALIDMFPLALTILKGARQRDECRGAHYKPAFELPEIKSTEPAERLAEAQRWCDAFEAKNAKWLKTTIAEWDDSAREPVLSYEDVDTSLISPRPRLYGVVGGDVIEKVWRERQQRRQRADEAAAPSA